MENCLAGYNSSIFAYGQTGAGKTYTMIGQLGKSDQVLHNLSDLKACLMVACHRCAEQPVCTHTQSMKLVQLMMLLSMCKASFDFPEQIAVSMRCVFKHIKMLFLQK